ncbi:MAG: tetratricopeptide repeat protein [Deltaproteobacteria bacterium]|nr:tetratricopeptide repeat protein [Deltaproteobacteria bacterium]
MSKLGLLTSVLTSSLLLSGCFWATTKSEGEALRKDVTSLQERILIKEKALDDQVTKLQVVLEDSSKLLKRNSADLGADVDQLRNEVRTANGLVTSINNAITELKTAFDNYRKQHDARLDQLEQRLGQMESGKPSANSSPDDLWKLGSTAFEAARYNDAIEIFKRMHQSFPAHERADDAIYFRGQAHTNLKDWEKAIGVYQMLLDKYPDGSLTDDGLYFAALAAQQLKQCTEARTYLGIIKSKYGKSNVAKQAGELDATIKKDAKTKAKCAS